MNSEDLKALQAPLKQKYVDEPSAAVATLHASGRVDLGSLTCEVDVFQAAGNKVSSGLHPLAGGDGSSACSGDMLLQSLVACSGVTLAAVSTAMGLDISAAAVRAEGMMDFRGTLGVDRETPIGLTSVSLFFDLESSEPIEKQEKLVQLTERYCVVLQTLKAGCEVSAALA